jgi:phage terminase large subunit-like protein
MWRALPFGASDEDLFRKHGYGDEFIAFMKRMHRRDSRNLLVCENITNAAKLGSRISGHYGSNTIFRVLFPEILPDSSCTWSNFSLHHKRTPGAASHGEGTFDFLGVGGALQSRHYDGLLVQDDLVGRKAIESISIMEKTIDYHRLLVGAFENPDENNHENDEFVVGNRWGYTDLSSHVREFEPWFNVVTHSALGGCCPDHPADTPIFPEEFGLEKLERWRRRLGNYHFSCQFLNNPAAPENADFREEWLQHFSIEEPCQENAFKQMIRHEVRDGVVRKDFEVAHLRIGMTVDPNHSGNAGLGRCRHAIMVVGLSSDGYYYLLDCWAKASGYDEFYEKIFELAGKWKLTKIGVETVAAQKYIGHHIEFLCKMKSQFLRIIPLKGEVEGPDGELTRKKEWRIRNVMAPIFEGCNFYTQRKYQDFLGEYTTFPRGRFVDQLDALAYMPQLIKMPQRYEDHVKALLANQQGARRVNMPYSAGVN